ncbi:hypothetical protein NONO_c51690 [Nocardia nova SH22a]|uniref:DoxX family protein n=1 Tax=Nocardia nova SH22a TaxID=1415166 RepID=W5TLX3_9NOCA|nr:hypothetical protein [Nocardia nova]AHH19953.1 hypothetical protein NONO_c51690 [Nocardia nova SH22a]
MTQHDPHPPTESPAPHTDDSPLRYFGWYLTIIGISHLIIPRRWDRITAIAFREPVRRWTLTFGISETAMGILFLRKRTRPAGIAAVVAQVIFLAYSFVSFRRGPGTDD